MEELLENELDISKIKQKSNTVVPYAERIKFKMIEKRKNHFDVLPQGWVKIDHDSGVPIYLHRPSRSVTISRPYCLGTASARVIFYRNIEYLYILDILFSSNHNIHKTLCGLCFWASEPLIDGF